MKLLRRHSSKGNSQVEVLLHIEDLYPWPAQHGTLAVQFLRGKRAGQTQPQNPDDENIPVASYSFDETLTVPATLYRASFGGSYEEKKLSIFIAQVDDKGKELNVLGGFEVNLADFADLQGTVRQSFPIECSSSIWKPAGGRPKLTMSVAVARPGDKAAVAELKQEISGPLFPVEEIPSSLSTDVEDEDQGEESVTTSPEPHATGGNGGSGGGKSGLFGIVSSRYGRGSSSNLVAAAAVGGGGAAAMATTSSPSPAKSAGSLRYDSDGFLIDSELTGQSPSGATTTTAAAGAAAESSQKKKSGSGTVVKRNLNKDLDDANSKDALSPLAAAVGGNNGGVASAASGTKNNNLTTPAAAAASSPGSIGQPSPQQEEQQHQQPVHTRRFSRGDGAALGSRKWAWRRQSNDATASGDGGGGNGDTSGGGGSPVSSAGEMHIPPTARSGVGASYLSGTSGVAGTAAAAGAAAAAAAATAAKATANFNYGTPDTTTLGISPSIAAGSLSSPSATASLHSELQIAAALESAIFLAGRGWGSSSSTTATSSAYREPKVEQLQAPARRLARTIIILGPEEGPAFGQRAVSAIRAAAASSLNDPHRLLLWWANTVTLRWSFWALGRDSSGGSGGNTMSASPVSTPGMAATAAASSHFDWLSRSLSPSLRHLEAQMYADLVNYLWNGVLVPTAVQSATEAAVKRDKINNSVHLASTAESKPSALLRSLSNGNSSSSRNTGGNNTNTTAEGAMDHWIRALRAVDVALTPAGRPPAAPRPLLSLLRRHVLTGMLTRLDGALIELLLYDNKNTNGGIEALLIPELIPISRCSSTTTTTTANKMFNTNSNRGSITTSFDFISGVELKMAAGRLVEYASELGIRDGPQPRIKEVADLLMTPKLSLGDEEVRRTVAPSLQPSILVKVLQKYQPDDADVSVDDKLPSALLKQLRAEAATTRSGGGGSGKGIINTTFGSINEAYVPPVEEVLLEEGIIQPLSLETSAESDDEMSMLEEDGDVRYALLRQLWGAVRAV